MILGHNRKLREFKNLADAGELKQGYLFFGPEGVGKKLLALSLVKYLEHGEFETPKILGDALLIEPSGSGTIGIEEVRKARNFLSHRPNASPRRTVVVDQAETLTEEAQNALLKIAEEPPPSGLLVLVATHPERLWGTLTSRLTKVYFGEVPLEEIEKWLLLRKVPGSRAKILARKSFGKPGLALMLWEDEKFQALEKQAQEFLSAKVHEIKEVIEKIRDKLDSQEFNFKEFLDAVILLLAMHKDRDFDLWHKVIELRSAVEFFALNPRLQLQNLFAIVQTSR